MTGLFEPHFIPDLHIITLSLTVNDQVLLPKYLDDLLTLSINELYRNSSMPLDDPLEGHQHMYRFSTFRAPCLSRHSIRHNVVVHVVSVAK